jgi:NAD(P)H-dependent FMN reductase
VARLQIILGSTRKGRSGHHIAAWFERVAREHGRFEVESIDLRDVNLPLVDEPNHPRLRQYQHEHTKAWGAIVQRGDAYVFVTPEYNYGPAPALLNALDYLVHEWAYKPAGFVSYGGVSGGTRGVQATKQVVSALKMVPMVEGVAIPFFAQHVKPDSGFQPPDTQRDAARVMLDELARWADALAPMRAPRAP